MTFKEDIIKHLIDKGLCDSSINLYIKNLERLNDGYELKDFKFLYDINHIKGLLEKYKITTKRGYLISIVSVIESAKGTNKILNNLYKKYYDEMININNKIKDLPTEKLSKAQADNWISWEDVIKKYDDIYSEVKLFEKKKEINKMEYEKLLELMVLSLYRWIPPRRNEYTNMIIVKKLVETLSTDNNYLSIEDNKFLFNQYKTVKKYGSETIDIPKELMNIILLYIKFHPLIKGKKKYNIEFLVYQNGKSLNKINSITRILNKLFDKKISSSMLRHIWNTYEYGETIKKMKINAEKMGHGLTQAIDYIKDI